MNSTWNKIEQLAIENSGLITTAKVEEAGISRTTLKRYVENSQLIRVRKGLYILENGIVDEYVLLQTRSEKALFSYGTALFFWGLSDRVPHDIDLSVPHGINVSKIKRDNPQVRFHYVKPQLFELGKTETTSIHGNKISLYDRERCICDLIQDKEKIDMQLYTQALKGYFRTGANLRKLLKYGKQFGIEKELRTYMEVLT